MAVRTSAGKAILMPPKILTGKNNYHNWSLATKGFLKLEKLWNTIEATSDGTLCTEPEKMDEAYNKIFLSVDENLWPQLENVTSPFDAWNKLKELYEDTGMARKVTLLCDLMTTKLENFENEESYINTIMSTCNRLQGAGMDVPDEFQSAILLAGLPASYRPLIMVVEVMQNPTAEKVRQKILLEAKWRERERDQEFTSNGPPAMFAKKPRGQFNNFRSRGRGRFPSQSASRERFQVVQCFRCQKIGHKASDCRVNSQALRAKLRHQLILIEQTKGKYLMFTIMI